MFLGQYFAHVSPSARTPWDFFRAEDYPYLAAGENLAIDFLTAQEAHTALMNSPTHRANILNSAYTEIGVAVGQSTFQGRTSIVLTQYFGRPRGAKPVSRAAPAAAPAKEPSVPQGNSPQVAKSVEQPGQKTVPVATNVLGTESDRAAHETRIGMMDVVRQAPLSAWTKALLIAVSALFLLPFLFVVLRTGESMKLVFRVVLLLAVFGGVIAFGIPEGRVDRITPSAVSAVFGE
jgi:hypothetical protein